MINFLTPFMAQVKIYNIVVAIINRKVDLKEHPHHALLKEIIAEAPWSERDVCDILDQLVLQERLLAGATINDQYYRLSD